MLNAYNLLGVDENASDEIIKQRYLQQVKNNPPEKDPEKFKAIREAFELIETAEARVNYQLFHLHKVEKQDIVDLCFKSHGEAKPLSKETMYTLLSP